ncbi:hypothetical protein ABT160_10255 [Streptomyces sp. NPDC001941]|uniref:hypothetical protein n=1 Tax=Streptomyces sp. NPDC001941 TaxID=3154659 RepID=UPI003321B127
MPAIPERQLTPQQAVAAAEEIGTIIEDLGDSYRLHGADLSNAGTQGYPPPVLGDPRSPEGGRLLARTLPGETDGVATAEVTPLLRASKEIPQSEAVSEIQDAPSEEEQKMLVATAKDGIPKAPDLDAKTPDLDGKVPVPGAKAPDLDSVGGYPGYNPSTSLNSFRPPGTSSVPGADGIPFGLPGVPPSGLSVPGLAQGTFAAGQGVTGPPSNSVGLPGFPSYSIGTPGAPGALTKGALSTGLPGAPGGPAGGPGGTVSVGGPGGGVPGGGGLVPTGGTSPRPGGTPSLNSPTTLDSTPLSGGVVGPKGTALTGGTPAGAAQPGMGMPMSPMMPMQGGPQGQQQGQQEEQSSAKDWLQEEESVWGGDQQNCQGTLGRH